MKLSFKNCFKYTPEGFLPFSDEISISEKTGVAVYENCCVFPTFADVHVHLREPGFSYKETVRTGTAAAARGGYGDICSMPNLSPVPDSLENLKVQTDIIKRDALINVHPYGSITKGEKGETLSDMETLAPYVAAFSDDGRGVQNEEMMKSAMIKAKSLGKIIAAHCEVNSMLHGGYIHDGEYARTHNHRGISSESEWAQVERDIFLAEKTGCKYHVCHISTKESADLIRRAKERGVDISCETAPHYLVLDDSCLKEDGAFKMNPPLRDKKDREALLCAVEDGTVDMIATDHAPHSAEEKSKGLEKSPFGIVGLETAFGVLYTNLVREKIISLDKLISLMSINPRKRFSLGGGDTQGSFTVFDLNNEYTIDSHDFLSMGKSTPFDGKSVYGKCRLTMFKGDAVWIENSTER